MIGTKGQYATHRGVVAGRVSQWITAGWLAGCLVGDGRFAQIDFEKADAELRKRLNVGQVMGQGRELPPPLPAEPSSTETEQQRTPFAPPPIPKNPLSSPDSDAAARIQQAKATQAELETARQVAKHKEDQGLYTLTSVARTEFSRRMTHLVGQVETWLPELSQRLAAHLVEGGATDKLSLQALIRSEWRLFRAACAQEATQEHDQTNPFISDAEEEDAQQD